MKKLSEEKINRIRKMYDLGYIQKEIAIEIGSSMYIVAKYIAAYTAGIKEVKKICPVCKSSFSDSLNRRGRPKKHCCKTCANRAQIV